MGFFQSKCIRVLRVHNTKTDSSRASAVYIYNVLAHLPADCVNGVSGFTSQAGQVDLEFQKECLTTS